MTGIIFQTKEVDKTQGGGDFTISNVPQDASEHQVTVETTGSPTAGTLSVQGKPPDAAGFVNIEGTIDMVNGPFLYQFTGHFTQLRFSPSGFNGTDYDVIVSSRR